MIQFFKKYKILLLFVYLTICASLASTPLTEFFSPPLWLSRIYSLLLYVPFAAVILWKLAGDIRKFRFCAVNLIYYLFALYYGSLTVCRLLSGMEVQENIYYSVTLFGSLALYCQIRDDRLHLDEQLYRLNFMGILVYMVIYKILASVLSVSLLGLPKVLGNPPVNELYSTSMLVLMIPFLADSLCKQSTKRLRLDWVLLVLSLILILACSSRAIFLLSLVVFAISLVIRFTQKRGFVRMLTAACCAVCIVGLLAAADVGKMRYSLYREIGLFGNQQMEDGEDGFSDLSEDETMEDALQQIERSDAMRYDLLKLGLEQVKKNPIFGTGDLFYPYDLGYMTLNQTPHNFIVESLICYGIIGTLMIAALLIAMLLDTRIICKTLLPGWNTRVSALIVLFYFFALGMVQPSVYNTLLCPLFVLVLAYYGVRLFHEPDVQVNNLA